jgi:CO/xanthine dehydrogenase FAD-binding subunit
MKPARFEYRAPNTLEEAVALLAADPEAKPIAGGQSLMPVLNFRLAAPTMLVDLRRVGGLDEIARDRASAAAGGGRARRALSDP